MLRSDVAGRKAEKKQRRQRQLARKRHFYSKVYSEIRSAISGIVCKENEASQLISKICTVVESELRKGRSLRKLLLLIYQTARRKYFCADITKEVKKYSLVAIGA
jgi:hypothetical protein